MARYESEGVFQMGIKVKIILLGILLGTLTAIAVSGVSLYNTYAMRDQILSSFRQTLIDERGEKLKAVTQTLMSVIVGMDSGREMYAEGEQLKVTGVINQLRYADDKSGYFWVNDLDCKIITHPIKPKLNGKNLKDLKDPNGKYLFAEFARVCRESGEGYVDYYWSKPGSEKPVAKLSFVQLYKPWNWVVGTGIYLDDIDSMVQDRYNDIDKSIDRFIYMLLGLVAVGLTAGIILAYGLASTITSGIKKFTDNISQAADQMAVASEEVASGSDSLAEGASRQAASLEETAALLQEIGHMTELNEGNTREAEKLAVETDKVVQSGATMVKEMIVAVQEISQASNETAKIIKTIDEIAFQTNLLSLNAAVEAARAGEAGAGFAVVANEVRMLAHRSAEAAKNTAELIGQAVERSDGGVELSRKVDESFTQISEVTSKVRTLIAEISEASVKQTGGLKQVNSAASEMESVTQGLAANSEESSAATNDLRHQTEHIVEMLAGLNCLVVGGLNRECRNQNVQSVQGGGFLNKQPAGDQKALPMSEEF